ncbi:ATP-binding SpoIIE family protein phosphatase [Micromonospora sp. NBC_01796]|uniref:ATP-binding SpoIIE family protein phosphatase n=1 Tax=Micromonospora sp. NBC_01796 TaxID=2975987 RepID=UPI002DDA343D|nr:SpoIIE family protein phosphatase [Micromonospora sp. NBC_01796]WSA87025.1 SpoIIE family protein phosphatase [Micromonospora sp. NBC_01796]
MSAGPAGDDGLNPAGPVHGTRQLPVGVDAGTTTVDTAGTGGGDWYDVVTSVDGHLVLVVGDVLDTGVPAVAAMGQLRTALLAELLGGVAPGTALTHLNAQFGNALRGSYAIVVCLEFDPHTGRLCYASAGHPSPVCLGPEGQIDLLHRRPLGPPIGAGPDARYDTIESRLAPGARLLFYSAAPARAPTPVAPPADVIFPFRPVWDSPRPVAAIPVEPAEEQIEELIQVRFVQAPRRPRADGVAILALAETAPNRFALRLPADPTKLSTLRQRLLDFLTEHQVGEEDLFDLVVAVSEAAANAIEHPVAPVDRTITVEVTVADGTVVATVRDSGQWREAHDPGFRGRGLELIRALGELRVSRTAEGTELTFWRRLSS